MSCSTVPQVQLAAEAQVWRSLISSNATGRANFLTNNMCIISAHALCNDKIITLLLSPKNVIDVVQSEGNHKFADENDNNWQWAFGI